MRAHQVVRGAHCQSDDDRSGVTEWRLQRLLESGFDGSLAIRLAATPGVDLHSLLELVGRGCRPDLAARILDPLAESDLTR